jgi:hypothetical protein
MVGKMSRTRLPARGDRVIVIIMTKMCCWWPEEKKFLLLEVGVDVKGAPLLSPPGRTAVVDQRADGVPRCRPRP